MATAGSTRHGRAAADPEHERRVGDGRQQRRVARVAPRDRADSSLLRGLERLGSLGPSAGTRRGASSAPAATEIASARSVGGEPPELVRASNHGSSQDAQACVRARLQSDNATQSASDIMDRSDATGNRRPANCRDAKPSRRNGAGGQRSDPSRRTRAAGARPRLPINIGRARAGRKRTNVPDVVRPRRHHTSRRCRPPEERTRLCERSHWHRLCSSAGYTSLRHCQSRTAGL